MVGLALFGVESGYVAANYLADKNQTDSFASRLASNAQDISAWLAVAGAVCALLAVLGLAVGGSVPAKLFGFLGAMLLCVSPLVVVFDSRDFLFDSADTVRYTTTPMLLRAVAFAILGLVALGARRRSPTTP